MESNKSDEGKSITEAVPESVMEAVNSTSRNLLKFKPQLLQFLSQCTPGVLEAMEPLQRANTLLMIAKANTTLFALRLQAKGVNPNDHRIKSELERLSRYEEKMQRLIDTSNAPLRPSATVNSQAATRFIEHSLPDLTPEQRQSMRELSKGEGTRIKYLERNVNKKRKCQSGQKQSVQTAAQEFLEKATRELLGDSKDGFKGPLRPQDSGDDDVLMD